jgi:hypothetical protein
MSVQSPVTEKTWIKLASGIDAYVLNVISENKISIGYHQNNLKAIKEDAVLQDGQWVFEVSGPSGSYLRGSDEAIVKSGPRG